MPVPRHKIVDLNATRDYHCISKCARGLALLGKGKEHRKKWVEDRLEELSHCFAISVTSFVVMATHLHVMVRIEPEKAKAWSDEEVARRWMMVYPPRGVDFNDEESVRKKIAEYLQDPTKIAEYRERLASLSWFMKCLKEPIARRANKEDGCTGVFWEGRFKSIAVIDYQALIATCAYIDLNPVAAGIDDRPENSEHTSLRRRLDHARKKGVLDQLRSAEQGSVIASRTLGNLEEDLWLMPLEDRRPYTNAQPSSQREGMLDKFTLGNYLTLVDHVGRMVRDGKATIAEGLEPIFKRLQTSFSDLAGQIIARLNTKSLWGNRFAAGKTKAKT